MKPKKAKALEPLELVAACQTWLAQREAAEPAETAESKATAPESLELEEAVEVHHTQRISEMPVSQCRIEDVED